MASQVILTLTSVDGLDDIPERTIIVHPNKPIPIGRSSKNPDKGLMAASDNALIDSPVISREHAVFSTSTDTKAPNIYIIDEKSRQGTYLNGVELKRGTSHLLAINDTVRFGQDVIRDTDSFTAQKYRVGYRLTTPEPDRDFPRGITVPEAVSSDEEDVDYQEPFSSSLYPPPNYGSKANPVNVDDFEDNAPMPRQPIHFQLEEEEEFDEVYEPPPANPIPESEASAVNDKPVSLSFNLPSSDDDEEGEEDIDYPDEDREGAFETGSTEAEFDSNDEESVDNSDNSDNESDRESILSGSDASGNNQTEQHIDAARRVKFGAMLDHVQAKPMTPVAVPAAASHTPPAQVLSGYQSPPRIQPYASLPTPADFFEPSSSTKANELSKENMLHNSKVMADAYFPTWDPPSMPRPSAPKTMAWTTGIDYTNPVLMREAPPQNPWFEENNNPFIPSNMYGRSSMTTYNTPPITLNPYVSRPTGEFSAAKDVEVYPPEPTIFAPALPRGTDSAEDTSSQPAPRTKVSIAEIVDENPQQPMTPTSVDASPSRKRKAEAFEAEDEEPIHDNPAVSIDETIKQTLAPSPATEEPSEEPPRKKPRSSFSLVASGLAAGFVLGGAAVISALASIDITQ
ncbi:hypothetical protein B0J11DRAFT_113451 [Dendryphion nanum]|uniref:FHA domain-containing protein n=1 Tax=Dendryphion nanum TaxID=256645 RepID=A0A9P9DBR6_9PLEO|nr:hypothetical protein B0J11DRAFT_113451 [Dendryphion nanum]